MNGNGGAIGEQNAFSTAFPAIARSTEATDRETFSRKIRLPRTIRFSKDFALIRRRMLKRDSRILGVDRAIFYVVRAIPR